MVAGVVIAGSIGYFYYHSSSTGHRLVSAEQKAIASAAKQQRTGTSAAPAPANCPTMTDANTTTPQGLVLAQSIGLRAPVLGGDGDPQLSVAVGHVPGSAWPNQPGTVLLAAHDVTYFSHINSLTVGQSISFVTPCATYTYRVTGHQVVKSGTNIYTSPLQNLLVLETCYPLNALYITPDRYLVTGELTGVQRLGQTISLPTVTTPTVATPPALAAQGLTLATNPLLLGSLAIEGSPSASWSQSPAPIDEEAPVLTAYFAALRASEQEQPGWWSGLTTSAVPFSASLPLHGASVVGTPRQENPVLTVHHNVLTGASLNVFERIRGGEAPGDYQIQIQMTVAHGTLLITQWKMLPA